MKLSISQNIRFLDSAKIIGMGIFLGMIYVLFSNGFQSVYPFINGAICGALIGMLVAFMELWVFTSGFRKVRFITLLALRTIIYLSLIFFILFNVIVVSRMFQNSVSYAVVLRDDGFQAYLIKGNFAVAILYSLVITFAINFTRMVSRKMGQGVLLSFIKGTFYLPVVQERIVMFLCLKNGAEISGQLSGFNFFRFLNEYFYDITEPVVKHHGIIYEYVEDLIVISWKVEKGLKNNQCVHVFSAINHLLERHKEKYYQKYQVLPQIVASLHMGKLVRSEIGSIKTQIVFHGDVMNTTARLLDQACQLNTPLLVSEAIISRLTNDGRYATQCQGSLKLKGKEKAIVAFSIVHSNLSEE